MVVITACLTKFFLNTVIFRNSYTANFFRQTFLYTSIHGKALSKFLKGNFITVRATAFPLVSYTKKLK